MNGQTGTGVELFVTNVTLEVLGLLVLNEHFVVFEITVAIPTFMFFKGKKCVLYVSGWKMIMYTSTTA